MPDRLRNVESLSDSLRRTSSASRSSVTLVSPSRSSPTALFLLPTRRNATSDLPQSPVSENNDTNRRNRRSWASRLRMSPLTAMVSRLGSRSAPTSPVTGVPEVPHFPPPTYEEVLSEQGDVIRDDSSIRSNDTNTSTEAVLGDITPLSEPPDPLDNVGIDKPLPDVEDKQAADTNNPLMPVSSAYSRVARPSTTSSVTVEMWTLQKKPGPDEIVPLSSFGE